MNPIWIIVGAAVWGFLDKRVFFWHATASTSGKLRLAEFFSDRIFTSTPEGFRIPSEKLMIVGQGINVDIFRPGSDKPIPHSILCVGRLSPVKNYEPLLRAVKVLRDQNKPYSLTIIGGPAIQGDAQYKKKLKGLVAELGINPLVTFLGVIHHRDLPRYYQSHRIYVNMSRTSSLDKAILEAMACGCISLSSNDAAKKLLPAGLVITDENPEHLAHQILDADSMSFSNSMKSVVEQHNLVGLIQRMVNNMSSVPAEDPRVLIAGYAYIRKNYFQTFDAYSRPRPSFILPARWPIKDGAAVYYPPERDHVYSTATFFTHSHYPVIGGLLKGWMPFMPFKLFRFREFDIFYNCNEPTLLSTLYNTLWAKLFGMKVVLFSWENISFDKKLKGLTGYIHRLILNANLACASGIVCGNAAGREIFRSLTGKLIAVIPLSGVDTEFFKPGLRPAERSELVYIFAGSISYRKGIDVMLEAFKNILTHIPSAHLYIVGSGEYKAKMEERIATLDLHKNVTVKPWTDHQTLRALFQSADIFLYPSVAYKGWEEQFGYSIAEASLCELPVIATRSGSIEDVVIDNITGLLVTENNAQELEVAMAKLGKDASLRHKLGKAGREYITEHFGYPTVAAKFHDVFKTLS